MKASLILHTKEVKGNEIVEIKIWQVPKTKDKPHGIKYSIVYVKGDKRNAEGKGDHRHFLDREDRYLFTNIWDLLNDFKKDLKKLRGRDWDED